MARHSNTSNIYSHHDDRQADNIAERSLNNEFVNPADSFGTVPDTSFGTALVAANDGKTARDKAKGSEDTVERGNESVSHGRAAHETHSLKDRPPVHADESFRDSGKE